MGNIDIYKLVAQYKLTETEERILSYILSNIERSLEMNVRDVAKSNYSSPATVVKLSKKIGFSGYTDMVYRLYYEMKAPKAEKGLEMDYLIELFQQINEEDISNFISLLNAVRPAPIFICGSGFSEPIAKYLSMKLLAKGYHAILTDLFAVYDQSSTKDSVVIIISQTGQTGNILKITEKAKKNKMPIVLFTAATHSPIMDEATISFLINGNTKLNDQNKEKNYFYPGCLFLIEYMSDYLGESN